MGLSRTQCEFGFFIFMQVADFREPCENYDAW